MSFFSFDEKVIPLDEWVQEFVNWRVLNHRDIFQAIKKPIELSLQGLEWLFTSAPPLVIIAIFALIAWRSAGRGVAVFSVITLVLVGWLGLWTETMVTLAMRSEEHTSELQS